MLSIAPFLHLKAAFPCGACIKNMYVLKHNALCGVIKFGR